MTILDALKSPELEPLTPGPAEAKTNADLRPAVELRRVTKRYGAVVAVDAVDFTVARGTLVTLLGPSGCGKTTTLRLIAGLEMASDGRLYIDGEDVTHRAASERDVSMVFQSYALFPHMSVMENVCYGLRASGLRRRRAEELAAEKLNAVGLSGFEKRFPSELSGGQQQRVAVARAIVLEPKVLLFDEPLSNLDAKLRRRVREDIRALQQRLGLTVVYVTHDQEEALAVSDRIIVMKDARIVQDGSPRDLYERPASRFIADFIGSANVLPVMVHRERTFNVSEQASSQRTFNVSEQASSQRTFNVGEQASSQRTAAVSEQASSQRTAVVGEQASSQRTAAVGEQASPQRTFNVSGEASSQRTAAMGGKISSLDGGDMARVTLGALELHLPHRGHAPGPAELAVRPQAFRLRAGAPRDGEIGGTIRKAAYLGSHMEYGLALDGIDGEMFVIDGDVASPLAADTRVAVSINPSGAALIPSETMTSD
jgi:ABC-type Fe3+/spermidine/putrescine transport system ATPase subunit